MRRLFLFLVVLLLTQLSGCSESVQLNKLSDGAVILAFGDSLTYGTGVNPATESYPAVLQQLSHFKVINAGVPGEVSQQGLARIDKLLDKYQPELVILCHGGNDIIKKLDKQALGSNLAQMIHKIRQANSDVVMLAVPTLGFLVNPDPVYQQTAEQYNVILDNDTIAELQASAELKSDPIHFNQKGYKILAENVFQLLQERGAL